MIGKCEVVNQCLVSSICAYPVVYVSLQVAKNVFVVFYSGERAKTKILKICEAFGANRYPFTENVGKQIQMIDEVHAPFFNNIV